MKHAICSNIVYVYVCVCVFLTGCKPDTICRENTKVGLVCDFRRVYMDPTSRQPMLATTWESITVTGLGQSEPLYNNTQNISRITLPMHISGDSTIYTLLYRERLDTLWVCHTNNPDFISMECGCAMNHTILSLSHTKHWMDSIAITNGSMTREGKGNLEIWMFETNQ